MLRDCCILWISSLIFLYYPKQVNHRILPKYWATLSTFVLTILALKFEKVHSTVRLLMGLKYRCMYGKQCWSWSNAAFCGVWSGSTLFAKACLSQNSEFFIWKFSVIGGEFSIYLNRLVFVMVTYETITRNVASYLIPSGVKDTKFQAYF